MMPINSIMIAIMFITFFIACKRDAFLVFVFSIIGILTALFSLKFAVFSPYIATIEIFQMPLMSILYMLILLTNSLIVCIFSYFWSKKKSDIYYKEEFYLFLLISTLGGMVVIIANHAVSFFIGIELVSISLLGIIGYTIFSDSSFNAVLKYGILSGISSICMLLGMILMFCTTGSLNINTWGLYIEYAYLYQDYLFLIGLALFFSTILFKLAFFPFHLWTAEIYEGAPIVSLGHLSGIYKIIFLLILIRFFSFFNGLENNELAFFTGTIACISILFGTIRAVFEPDIKKLFGYTSIAQSGYFLALIMTGFHHNKINLENINFYIVSYLLGTLGVFSILNLIDHLYKNSKKNYNIQRYVGLFWNQPFLAISATIMLFSLVGIPPTCGFFGKYYLFLNIISGKFSILGVSGFIGSILGMYCYFKIIAVFYQKVPKIVSNNVGNNNIALFLLKLIVFVITFLIILFGIFPQILINFLKLNIFL
ncbi:NADH-quinone oxidoreductase subunit N [Buchnera aphidicola]|uniref:NADH-quinone oxidoreductase subunit N n=1 Tax=Buchnera aphidicola TaxID=9 RepID=UPI003463C73C